MNCAPLAVCCLLLDEHELPKTSGGWFLIFHFPLLDAPSISCPWASLDSAHTIEFSQFLFEASPMWTWLPLCLLDRVSSPSCWCATLSFTANHAVTPPKLDQN
ncbi:hypothetical protein LR48_Vigan03g059000 [Vigna angularis]|uniref:Uncharacterized protein n=1 Tax=Phaseolus angularis TaxID=3914 RepID=A0A0L9U474_PHAAN|nr:hypothetical protein LR48_Vigan03g059000 [Vigna angularis]